MSEIRWEVVDGPQPDAGVLDAWDHLAAEAGRPYCAPGWMLGWGDRGEPERAVRLGVVRDGARVIGVLPLRAGPAGAYELLGAGLGYRIEPLAATGRRAEVAAAAGELLAALDPPVSALALQGIDAGSDWGEALAAALPGRWRVERDARLYAPALELGDAASYEEWLSSRGGHFRKRALADRRRFERVGRTELAATPPELERAVAAFARLHLARWRGRGQSRLDFPGMEERLLGVAARLGPERLRAATAVVDGEIVSVDLAVHAGGFAASWNGGWDPAYRELRPGWQTLMASVEDAIERGAAEIDLGPGEHPWKRRLATREGAVVTDRVIQESSQ